MVKLPSLCFQLSVIPDQNFAAGDRIVVKLCMLDPHSAENKTEGMNLDERSRLTLTVLVTTIDAMRQFETG